MNLAVFTWELAGWTMLHFLWVGTVIGLTAAIGRRLLRSAGPDARYAFALACLAALAVAPILIAVRLAEVAPAPIEPDSPLPALSASLPIPLRPVPHSNTPLPAPVISPAQPVPIHSYTPPPRRPLDILVSTLPWLWLVGAPTTFALLAAGLIGAERLKRRSRPMNDAVLSATCLRLSRSLGLARPVAVAVCDRIASPILLGIVQPLILLPISALGGWTPERLEMVLLHELAHVRRRDNLVNLLQRSVESALFFHPAVWLVSAWVRLEREHCCDRVVVSHTGRPLDYAETLFALSTSTAIPLASVPMAESHLVSRIRRILHPEDHPMKLSRGIVALAAAALLAPAVAVVTYGRQAQDDDKPTSKKADPVKEADPVKSSVADVSQILRDAAKTAIETSIGGRPPHPWAIIDVASAQAKLGDVKGAKETFRAAVEAASRLAGGKPDTYELWRVGAFQKKAGDPEGARSAFRLASEATEDYHAGVGMRELETLGIILHSQVEVGDSDGSKETLKRAEAAYEERGAARDEQQDLPVFAGIKAVSGDVEGAFALIDEVNRRKGRPEIIKQAITARIAAEIAKAVAVWNDRNEARKVLDRVSRLIPGIELAENKYFPLGTIASAWAQIGDFERAMEAARQIGEGPTKVKYDMRDGKSYNMLLIALEQLKNGDSDGAKATLREAYESAKTLGEDRGRSGRLLQVAGGMVATGDFPGAVVCAQDMERGSKYETYANIAAAQLRAGQRELARENYRLALEDAEFRRDNPPQPRGKEPTAIAPGNAAAADPETMRIAYISAEIAAIQAGMGSARGALETIDAIPEGPWKLHAFEKAAQSQAASGDVKGAIAWIRARKSTEERSRAYQGLAEGIAIAAPPQPPKGDQPGPKASKTNDAPKTPDDPIRQKLRDESKNLNPDRVTPLLTIAAAQADAKDIEGMKETFKKALAVAEGQKDPQERAYDLTWTARAMAPRVGLDEAKPVFAKAVESSRMIEDKVERVSAEAYAARNQVEQGDVESGRKTFAECLDVLKSIDERLPMANARLRLISDLVPAGELETAMEVIAEIDPTNEQVSHPLRYVMEAVPKVKERERAETILARAAQLANVTKFPGDRGESRQLIAEAMAKRGDFDGAIQVARNVAEGADPQFLSYLNGQYQPASFVAIARAMGEANRRDDAKELLREAYGIVAAQMQSVVSADQLGAIAKAQCEVGDLDEAIKTIDAIPENEPDAKSHTYAALARAQVRDKVEGAARSVERAIALAEAIGPRDDIGNYNPDFIRAHAFDDISKAQYALGDIKGAIATATARIKQPLEQGNALNDLVDSLLKAGNVKEAQRAALLIEEDYRKSLSCEKVAQAQAEAGQEEEASAWIEGLKPSESLTKSRALLGLTRGKAKRQSKDAK